MNETRPPIDQIFAEAFQHHHAGRLAEAEQLYRKILAIDARHADSLHLLGALAFQAGRSWGACYFLGINIKKSAVKVFQTATPFGIGRILFCG